MNWKEIWDRTGTQEDSFAQVGRGEGSEHKEQQLDDIVQHIVHTLGLTPEDTLLDICCGNGLLTSRLAAYCKKVVGVDFSEVLINQARHHFPAIEFIRVDALELNSSVLSGRQFDKVNLYFSFQYFDSFDKGKKVIENMLSLVAPDGKLLLGDVPDREYFFVYYNSFRRIASLVKKMLQDKNDMGKFWNEEELLLICKQLEVKGEKLRQPRNLPHAHYRMDFLISNSKE